MRVKILRQQYPGAEPYWQTFLYDGDADASVAAVLDTLNYKDDVVDADGNHAPRIGWECSCLQGLCGGCAMVINGHPALACETFVRDLGEEIVLRPLSKFPVISDLVVDRGVIQENLKASGDYIGEYTPPSPKEHAHQYAAAKCLKCGLCLEVCPNYGKGEHFYGAVFANDCYLVASTSKEQGESFRKEYAGHFAAGCSKSLSCMEVCPMQIPTIASMAKLNRRG
ncbi:MAG: succinate dehydrogenase/fumarate reductase iron-sulfur subunit [Lachnospiraceae bacterium]|nr:succinate dehydrogenase/fumarate reductase iron-sulfur subunit [Lachnospiraceae bacterium]